MLILCGSVALVVSLYGAALNMKKPVIQKQWIIGEEEVSLVFSYPGQMVSFHNHLFVIDTKEHCVKMLTPQGELRRILGRKGPGPQEFLSPYGMAVGKNTLYVGNSKNLRMEIFAANGDHRDSFKVPARPSAVAVEAAGTLLIAFPFANRLVHRYSPSGTLLASMVDLPKENDSLLASFYCQVLLAVNDKREFFVIHQFRNLIERYDASGKRLGQYTRPLKKEYPAPKVTYTAQSKSINACTLSVDCQFRDGKLFVLTIPDGQSLARHLDVLDGNGAYLESIEMPDGANYFFLESKTVFYANHQDNATLAKYIILE